jgi:leucyl-tRNA synthetase
MQMKNIMEDFRTTPVARTEVWDEAVRSLVLMMAPFTPHIAEELWSRSGGEYSIHRQPWPEADPIIAAEDVIELVVQVNGKVRDKILVPADVSEEVARQAALSNSRVSEILNGATPSKVIYVPRRLINVVT